MTKKGADLTTFGQEKKGADLTKKGADLTNSPAMHSCKVAHILHSECATVELQQSREVQTGMFPGIDPTLNWKT